MNVPVVVTLLIMEFAGGQGLALFENWELEVTWEHTASVIPFHGAKEFRRLG